MPEKLNGCTPMSGQSLVMYLDNYNGSIDRYGTINEDGLSKSWGSIFNQWRKPKSKSSKENIYDVGSLSIKSKGRNYEVNQFRSVSKKTANNYLLNNSSLNTPNL